MDSTSDCKHTRPVAALISREIEQTGVISFARFMEIALYHEEHGYYNRNNSNIGRTGDFFTSVSVGSLFGEMLAFWVMKQGIVQIVEAGANDGSLAADILKYFNGEYWIVEPSPVLQAKQKEKLTGLQNVKWFSSMDEMPSVQGAIISNELLDAFPVQVFRWTRGRWRELGVNAEFTWAEMPGELDLNLGIEEHLPDGFTMELSPAAEAWWETAARKLSGGLMLALDYGDEAPALWTRAEGTLRAYRSHQLVANVLANPGGQDITASVNFTRIREAGERVGLISEPLVSQATFLSRIAADFFEDAPSAGQVRQFQTLTHPEHLGRAFKVLVQRARR